MRLQLSSLPKSQTSGPFCFGNHAFKTWAFQGTLEIRTITGPYHGKWGIHKCAWHPRAKHMEKRGWTSRLPLKPRSAPLGNFLSSYKENWSWVLWLEPSTSARPQSSTPASTPGALPWVLQPSKQQLGFAALISQTIAKGHGASCGQRWECPKSCYKHCGSSCVTERTDGRRSLIVISREEPAVLAFLQKGQVYKRPMHWDPT